MQSKTTKRSAKKKMSKTQKITQFICREILEAPCPKAKQIKNLHNYKKFVQRLLTFDPSKQRYELTEES
ncbi:MAG: hypothetical protein M1561_07985 [Gammaproteobacteria bacterium]|nr:hypothetical protein [Gammaproteobacteria bacterium]